MGLRRQSSKPLIALLDWRGQDMKGLWCANRTHPSSALKQLKHNVDNMALGTNLILTDFSV